MDDEKRLEEFLKDISNRNKFVSYVPTDFTIEWMLKRLRSYLEDQDFCSITPKAIRRGFIQINGNPGSNCIQTCKTFGLICDHDQLQFIKNDNDPECRLANLNQRLTMPSYIKLTQMYKYCEIQQKSFISCSGKDPKAYRVCPCNSYRPGEPHETLIYSNYY
ncbi:Alpha-1,6-mannosylglycoprotein 6-beta-N-acetylglucosaminyltransferase A [Thelohanellus kitauei]|uniref:alpha-1,6-mannosyl-glycoprotein 6-beta-N-acetylglucosaminyltransferase n=1 Tax=Thelohanellus kitauei TaxID=669202 RepID=A0A0C2MWC2_THEKT|nr:Alpha-1,6-mannosylglycoprotein 6-beta-N-acetylglucosaminyltransferase A [Thelohanellus kitauei]